MPKALRIFLLGTAATLILGTALFGFAGEQINVLKQKADPIYSAWMKEKADDTALRNLAIPGTHDTVARYSIGDLAGQCQTLEIKDQLNIGVRFLDLRLQQDGNSLKGMHGIVDQRISFPDIVKTIDAFLNDNPSEFIIASIKEEGDAKNSNESFETTLKKQISSKWVADTSFPSTLGEARGKVYILSRYANSTIGIPAYDGWTDNASFTLPNGIYVQDTYKTDVKTKKQEIESCFAHVGSPLKINFLSGYVPGSFPPSYAPSIANDINPWIDVNIGNYDDKGIVLYDFVDSAAMKAFFGGKLK